jgi:hypothetical protein
MIIAELATRATIWLALGGYALEGVTFLFS